MPDLPSACITRRHRRLRDALTRLDLELFVVSALPNIFYLSGFKGTAGLFLVSADRAALITDGRYKTAARDLLERAGTGIELSIVEHSYEQALVEALKRSGAARIGFEATDMTVSRQRWLVSALSNPDLLIPTEGVVEQLRAVKDESELAAIREGGRRIHEIFQPILEQVQSGRREDDVAAGVERCLREGGFSRPSFPTIVASGPNTALPHARASDRILQPGDLVMLDFGGVYEEYCVDLTRMISLGPADARVKSTYAAVRDAHEAAFRAVRPGVAGYEVDGAARGSLERAGFADAFSHGTGHGLGIEVHESPRISRPPLRDSPVPAPLTSAVTLLANMVFTIEPGVYFPEWGGIRLEDDVVVTESGGEMLTTVTRELIER